MRSDSDPAHAEVLTAIQSAEPALLRPLSPALVEEMIEALPYSVAALDRRGIITSTNAAWRRFASENGAPALADSSIGVDYLEVCRHATGLFMEGAYQALVGIQSVLSGTRPLYSQEYPCPSPTEQRWFLMLVSSLPLAQGGVIVSHIPLPRPQTEIERARVLATEADARTKAESASRVLSQLQMVTDVAILYRELPKLESALKERIQQAMDVDDAWILLVSDDGRELVSHVAPGPQDETGQELRVPIARGVVGRIAVSREPLVVDDLSVDDGIPRKVSEPEEMRSFAGVPLLVADRLIGVLGMSSTRLRHFTVEDVDFLRLVSDRIAPALERARLDTIAQRARAEAETRAAQLAEVVDSIRDPLFVFDRDGRVLYENAADRVFIGLAPDAPSPRTIQERGKALQLSDLQGHPLPTSQWPVSRVLRGEAFEEPHGMDLLFHTMDGRAVITNVSGGPIRSTHGELLGGVLVMRDVTERRTIERRTRELLGALLGMTEALIAPQAASTDTPGMNLIARRLAELTRNALGCERISITALETDELWARAIVRQGWPAQEEQRWYQEAVQYRLADVVPPQEIARLRTGEVVLISRPTMWSTVPVAGKPKVLIAPLTVESRLIGVLSLDFGDRPHTYTPDEMAVAGAVGQLAALVLERDRLRREREEAVANELASRQVKERMDEFLAMATHDLRTPISVAKLAAQDADRRIVRQIAALEDGESAALPADTIRADLELITDSMSRLAQLVDRLMDVSRVRAGKLDLHKEPHDLRSIIRPAVEDQRLLAPHRELRLRKPSRTVVVNADADRIGQVITNFLTNAMRYAPEQTPIDVTLRIDGNQARVSVRDRGPGIRREEQTVIWERFQQAEHGKAKAASSGGLGIGLYISRELIQLHGGQIGVRSVPGQGSTFWFRLPLAQDAGASARAASAPPAG